MKSARVTSLVALMFVLAMAAGVAVGRLTSRSPPQPHPNRVAGDSLLSDELQLSPDQCQQMRVIWEVARDTARSCAAEAERIQSRHDQQLQSLLTSEQKGRYEQLSQESHRQIAGQDARRKEAFQDAVDRTKKILRPDQWRAYEQIIENRVGAVPGMTDQPRSAG